MTGLARQTALAELLNQSFAAPLAEFEASMCARLLRTDAGAIDPHILNVARRELLGVTERTAMGVIGWSSTAMTAKYQQVIDPVKRDVATQVNGLLWESPSRKRMKKGRKGSKNNNGCWKKRKSGDGDASEA